MWVGIGLKLLGVGDLIKKFFLNNWKWLVPVIALVVSFFIVSDKYYNKGISEEKARWELKIKEEDARNREFEAKLNKAIATFGKKTVEEALERVEQETIYKDKIQTIVKNNPVYSECLVGQDVIDNRNAIRTEGPAYPIRIELADPK